MKIEFNKKVERETIRKLNALMGFKRRSYYNPKKYKERKQREIQKHIDNCRELNCCVKENGNN